MRAFILKAFPGKEWDNKVKKMADNQIIAIYYNLLSRKEVAIVKNDHEDKGMRAKQLSIFDIY